MAPLVLDEQETPVRAGHVVARPAGTGVAHMFRAGDGALTYLAYGTREPGDVCYYPRSNKIAFRGVGIMARLSGSLTTGTVRTDFRLSASERLRARL